MIRDWKFYKRVQFFIVWTNFPTNLRVEIVLASEMSIAWRRGCGALWALTVEPECSRMLFNWAVARNLATRSFVAIYRKTATITVRFSGGAMKPRIEEQGRTADTQRETESQNPETVGSSDRSLVSQFSADINPKPVCSPWASKPVSQWASKPASQWRCSEPVSQDFIITDRKRETFAK